MPVFILKKKFREKERLFLGEDVKYVEIILERVKII